MITTAQRIYYNDTYLDKLQA